MAIEGAAVEWTKIHVTVRFPPGPFRRSGADLFEVVYRMTGECPITRFLENGETTVTIVDPVGACLMQMASPPPDELLDNWTVATVMES